MAVNNLSNERRPQVTVPQDQVTEPQVTVPQNPESKFYIFENLPPPGKHFDDPKETVDTYTAKTAPNLEKDAKKLPNVAENINIILANEFADRDHYVRIDYVGCKLFYFLKWKNGMAAQKPIQLFEFNESNPPIVTKDFLAFEIGQKDITIEDNGNTRKVVLKDGGNKSMMGPARYLTIPFNAHKSYINYYNVVDVDIPNNLQILAGGKLIKQHDLTQVKNGGSDKTTLYTLDTWPAGDAIKPKPSTDKIAIEKTPKPKDGPTPPQEFAERVVNRVTRDGVPEIAEIVFTIDTSWSMEPAILLLIRSIGNIYKGLKKRGVKSVRVGVITFNDCNSIHLLLPLTEMNEKGIIKLFGKLSKVKNTGGREPTGEAALKSIKVLRKGNDKATKAVFVIFDEDAEQDDLITAPYLPDAIKKGEKYGISVNLEKITNKYGQFSSFYKSHSNYSPKYNVVTEVHKWLVLGNINKLLELAKDNSNDYIRLEAAKVLVGLEKEMGEVGKKTLIDLALNSLPDIRIHTAKILANLGEDVGKKILFYIANNDVQNGKYYKYKTNIEAAKALASLGKKAKAELFYLAYNSSDNYVRLEAAKGLVAIGEKAGINILLKLAVDVDVTDADSFNVRLKAAKILAIHGVGLGKSILLEIAQHNFSGWMNKDKRIEAAATLAILDEEVGVEILLDIAKYIAWNDYNHLDIAKYIAKKDYGYDDVTPIKVSSIYDYLKTKSKKELLDLAKNSSGFTSEGVEAVKILANIGEDVKKELFDISKNASNVYVRLNAAKALAIMGYKYGNKVLLNAYLNHGNAAAVMLLAEVGEKAKKELLYLVKKAKYKWVRLEAAKALAKLDDKVAKAAAKKTLLKLAKYRYRSNISTGFHAAKTLVALGAKEGEENLLDLAKYCYNQKNGCCKTGRAILGAAILLAELGNEESKYILLSCAKYYNKQISLLATATLAKHYKNSPYYQKALSALWEQLSYEPLEALLDNAKYAQSNFNSKNNKDFIKKKKFLLGLAENSPSKIIRKKAAKILSIFGEELGDKILADVKKGDFDQVFEQVAALTGIVDKKGLQGLSEERKITLLLWFQYEAYFGKDYPEDVLSYALSTLNNSLIIDFSTKHWHDGSLDNEIGDINKAIDYIMDHIDDTDVAYGVYEQVVKKWLWTPGSTMEEIADEAMAVYENSGNIYEVQNVLSVEKKISSLKKLFAKMENNPYAIMDIVNYMDGIEIDEKEKEKLGWVTSKATATINKALFLEDKDNLLKLAKYDPDGYTSLKAAKILMEIGEPEAAKKAFLNIAENTPDEEDTRSWDVRLKATKALVEIGEIEDGMKVFIEILLEYDPKEFFWRKKARTMADIIQKSDQEFAKAADKAGVAHELLELGTHLAKNGKSKLASKIVTSLGKWSTNESVRKEAIILWKEVREVTASKFATYYWPLHFKLTNLVTDWENLGSNLSFLASIPMNLQFSPSFSQYQNGWVGKFFLNAGIDFFHIPLDSDSTYTSASLEAGLEYRLNPMEVLPFTLSTSLLYGVALHESGADFKESSTYGAEASLSLYGIGLGAKYDSYLDKFFYFIDIDVATMLGLLVGPAVSNEAKAKNAYIK